MDPNLLKFGTLGPNCPQTLSALVLLEVHGVWVDRPFNRVVARESSQWRSSLKFFGHNMEVVAWNGGTILHIGCLTLPHLMPRLVKNNCWEHTKNFWSWTCPKKYEQITFGKGRFFEWWMMFYGRVSASQMPIQTLFRKSLAQDPGVASKQSHCKCAKIFTYMKLHFSITISIMFCILHLFLLFCLSFSWPSRPEKNLGCCLWWDMAPEPPPSETLFVQLGSRWAQLGSFSPEPFPALVKHWIWHQFSWTRHPKSSLGPSLLRYIWLQTSFLRPNTLHWGMNSWMWNMVFAMLHAKTNSWGVVLGLPIQFQFFEFCTEMYIRSCKALECNVIHREAVRQFSDM